MKKSNIIKLMIASLILFAAIFYVIHKKTPGEKDLKEKVRIANAKSVLTFLMNVAETQGYFQEEGLDVDMALFDVGKSAMESMFKGENDFALAAIAPIVHFSLMRNDFKIVGTISFSNNLSKMVCRKDKGIGKPADLKGKRINATRGTALDFFLTLFLNKSGIRRDEVILSSYDVKTAIKMLVNGELDAVVAQEPFIYNAAKTLGEKAAVFEAEGLSTTYAVLIVNSSYTQAHPETVVKILKAIHKAAVYYGQHSDDILVYGQKLYGIGLEELRKVLADIDFKVTLKQSLIFSLEKELEGMKKMGIVSHKKVPVYLDFVEEEYLKKILPKNVDLIR